MAAIGSRRLHHPRKKSGENCPCGCGRLTMMVRFFSVCLNSTDSRKLVAHHFLSLDNVISLLAVNVRLLGERLEQNNMEKTTPQESQQARWPSSRACPGCWREDGSWDDERVFDHLHQTYWKGGPRRAKILPHHVVTSSPHRAMPLKWKVVVMLFVVAGLVARKPRSKRKKRRHTK